VIEKHSQTKIIQPLKQGVSVVFKHDCLFTTLDKDHNQKSAPQTPKKALLLESFTIHSVDSQGRLFGTQSNTQIVPS
jgi:hypothetical protein